jgi:glycosyltransferase involved in cell wall biosynthesis
MSEPKVSIVVPVYNAEKYLTQCVESILAQTLQEIEVILVDDGSQRECAELCDKLAETDARIKVIHKTNGGAGLARNTGLEVAHGEYVGFVDSDDYIKPTMFETLYASAVKHDADLVISGVCFVGGNTFSQSGDYSEKQYFEEDTVFEGEGMKQLLLGVVGAKPQEREDSRYGVSVWKNLFRRELLCREGIVFVSEREFSSEDTIFMVDYIKRAQKAVGIPGAFYCYRRNDESFSKAYRSDRFEKILIFLSALEDHIKDALPEEEYRLYLDRLVQGYGRVLCSQEIMHAHDERISYRALRARLKQICTHERMAAVLKSYPWYQLPKKQAAFAFAMKHRLYLMQRWMVLLRAR